MRPLSYRREMKTKRDKRTTNRLKEHSGDGHGLGKTDRTSPHQPNSSFYVCLCGWFGWLKDK